MNVIKAAEKTLALWKGTEMFIEPSEPSLSFDHCSHMVETMKQSPFSYGKLCRWLGWIQAACVANTDLNMEDIKQINKENKSTTPTLAQIEKDHILIVLAESEGVTDAARKLGIGKTTLYRRLQEWGVGWE